MKNKILYLLAVLVLFASSCREDSITGSSTTTDIPSPSYSVAAAVSGIITDLSGEPIENAMVQIADRSITTDKHGYFTVDALVLDKQGQFVTVEKSGYFQGYTFIHPELDRKSHVRLQMVDKEISGSFESAAGGKVLTNGGASVDIPADGVVLASGGSYSGKVNVYAHWYDPSDDFVGLSMPGDLRALSLENQLVQLATFGMIGVELESDSGQKLQLASGIEATLEFPLAADLASNASADIPLWHFDEANGYWMEDGVATLDGNKYVAQVSHFSFWNCDAPFPVVPFKAQVVDEDGDPLQGRWMCITVLESGLTRSAWSDSQGYFYGKVPKDKEMKIEIKNFCNEVMYTEVVGPFSTDVDLGQIVVMNSSFTSQVTARILDCSNMPLQDGYVVVKSNSGIEIMEPNEEGYIDYSVSNCEATTLVFYAFDPVNLLESDEIEITVDGNDIDLGDIVVCDVIEEYITYSIDGGATNLINDPRADLEGGSNIIMYGGLFGDTLAMNTLINNVSLNTAIVPAMVQASGFVPSGNFTSVQCVNGSANSDCSTVTFTFTEFDANVGSFIVGTFTGTFANATGTNTSLTGAFRIEIDQAYDFATIQGQVFRDENGDGLRDAGDPPVVSQPMYIRSTDSQFLPGLIELNAVSASDGSYAISGLTPGISYQLIFQAPNQTSVPTLFNVGSDDTIDNDFDPATYATDDIVPASGEIVPNVDLGILAADPLICDAFNEGCMYGYVSVQGGTPPYQYNLDDGTTNNQGFFENLAPGIYNVTVVDAVGEQCNTSFIIDADPFFSGKVWVDQAGGTDNVYDVGVDTPLENVDIGVTNGNSTNIWYSVKTDSNGNYTIDNLYDSDFRLKIEVPTGYVLLEKDQGSDNTDNDFDPTTTFTDIYFMDCGTFQVLDAGLKVQ